MSGFELKVLLCDAVFTYICDRNQQEPGDDGFEEQAPSPRIQKAQIECSSTHID
jgi:hypothetical protein